MRRLVLGVESLACLAVAIALVECLAALVWDTPDLLGKARFGLECAIWPLGVALFVRAGDWVMSDTHLIDGPVSDEIEHEAHEPRSRGDDGS